jgi:outer membrane protein OmpA-like peptidoglycan-associated protein/tetratricopeptide (TPR) repeat protein
MKNILLVLLLAVATVSCKSQTALSTKSKKALKAYQAAEIYLGNYDYPNAMAQLHIAQKEDPNFVEAFALEAQAHMQLGEWQLAVDYYKKAFAINPNFYPAIYFDCAEGEMKLGKYADAKADYQTFLTKRPNASQELRDKAELGIRSCDYAVYAMAHPVPFEPLTIGDGINTAACEYFPNVTADDQTFLFTRNEVKKDPSSGAEIRSQEDFYISFRDDQGNWSLARPLGAPVNTPVNEGAPSLSPDGHFLFFAACESYDGYGAGRQGFGSCDIFFTQKINGQWQRAANVGAPLNTNYWETQPSWSSDGKTLYFISNRRGGYGDSDIWMAVLGEDGKWSTPVNLGAEINTPWKEESVFIHPDNQTLYFASEGHVGMGGLDLYVCRRDSTGKWGPPVNLGYPINTFGDESGLIVNGTGNLAYFTSTRDGGKGCDDIYKFEMPLNIRPYAVTYMKGKVYDKKTGAPLGASFNLIDLATSQTIIFSSSDPGNGEFLVCIPVNKNYALNVNCPGYLFYSERFLLKEATDPNKPFMMNVPMQPIDTGAIVELKNVYFETAKFDLRPESQAELNKVALWLQANPGVKVEFSGHTDNVGDKKSNQLLSENRAKAVYVYLIQQGVPASQMTYKGYGDTKPKVKNDTPENRQLNRRVEMKILSTK